MELSIIIPAYNASNTLKRAVDSVLVQMDENIELLIVENGSSDNTAQLAEKIAKQNNNVIFIKSDKGVSKARNIGLSMARGRYVTFLDADDVLSKQALRQILKNCQSGLDLYIYKIKMGTQSIRSSGVVQKYDNGILESGMSRIIRNPTKYMQVCASVYRKKIINDYNVTFDETMYLSEDSDFTLQFLSYINSFQLIDEVVYESIGDNKQSATRKPNPEKVAQMMTALTKTEKKATWLKRNNVLVDAFNYYILMNFNVVMVRGVFNRQVNVSFWERYKEVMKYSQSVVFYDKIKKINVLSELKSIRMWSVILIKLNFTVLAAMMFYIRAWYNDKIESK